ncbi:FAD-binding protein, partial [Brachybacterium sp.]
HGEDFLQADSVPDLVRQMNALTGEELIEAEELERVIRARDAEVRNPFSKDAQITALRGTRKYVGDRLIRTAAPHRLLDAKAGPLIAVRLHVLLRKTLGGLETDLGGRVQREAGTAAGTEVAGTEPLAGLYAAGEASGFGGGGVHGHNALEGTFLGGCLFSGRQAARGILVDLR